MIIYSINILDMQIIIIYTFTANYKIYDTFLYLHDTHICVPNTYISVHKIKCTLHTLNMYT